MTTSRVKYQIEVYDITVATGYKTSSNAINTGRTDNDDRPATTPLATWLAMRDSDASTHFTINKYPSSLPSGPPALQPTLVTSILRAQLATSTPNIYSTLLTAINSALIAAILSAQLPAF